MCSNVQTKKYQDKMGFFATNAYPNTVKEYKGTIKQGKYQYWPP